MKARTFSDVTIIPKFTCVGRNGSLATRLCNGEDSLELPIISANMPAIANAEVCDAMRYGGGMGILHRFNEVNEAVEEYNHASFGGKSIVGVSLGVKNDDTYNRFEKLYEAGARVFCIDVAHGHQDKVHSLLKWINNQIFQWARSERNKVTLIAGNVATADAVIALGEWGADIVKVGIGPGSACTTRLDTGVGVPQLYALEQAHNAVMQQKVPVKIISDGGCKCTGDIAKALKYADAVMVGFMLAGTTETPGEYINVGGKQMKVYFGSASFKNKGEKKHIEGRDFLVEKKGSISDVLDKIRDGLHSSLGYVGASNLQQFKNNCEFLDITAGGKAESKYE